MIYVRQDTEEAFTPLHLVSQLFKIYFILFHDVFGASCRSIKLVTKPDPTHFLVKLLEVNDVHHNVLEGVLGVMHLDRQLLVDTHDVSALSNKVV